MAQPVKRLLELQDVVGSNLGSTLLFFGGGSDAALCDLTLTTCSVC